MKLVSIYFTASAGYIRGKPQIQTNEREMSSCLIIFQSEHTTTDKMLITYGKLTP